MKEGELETVREAITRFVDAITENEPDTVYTSYQENDGLSFTHFMRFSDEEAEKTHQTASYTMDFVEVLYPRCEATPVFADLMEVRSTPAGEGAG